MVNRLKLSSEMCEIEPENFADSILPVDYLKVGVNFNTHEIKEKIVYEFSLQIRFK